MEAMRGAAHGALALLLLLAPSAHANDPEDGVEVPKGSSAKATGSASGRAAQRARRLRAFAQDWLGTPYLWGGTTKSGIDCSGFLREMFRRIYNVELPRTTSQQISLGVPIRIDRAQLGRGFEPGDLFFYVDSTGTPNHVVTYIGSGQFTHSASGRGVVIDGYNALWGRRIIARRVLVPAGAGDAPGGAFEPIAPSGPLVAEEIPCPPSIRARAEEIRRFRVEPIGDLRPYASREICDWKALKSALLARPGPATQENAARIDRQIEWLESIEALKEQIGG